MHAQCWIWLLLFIWGMITTTLLCMKNYVPVWIDYVRYGLTFGLWIVMWLIGMAIFFNVNNDCGAQASTRGMTNLVCYVLVQSIILVSLFLCCLPCFLIAGCIFGCNWHSSLKNIATDTIDPSTVTSGENPETGDSDEDDKNKNV